VYLQSKNYIQKKTTAGSKRFLTIHLMSEKRWIAKKEEN